MAVIEDVIQNLIDIGFYEIVLPWLFIFAIVFGLLSKLNLFDREGKNKKLTAKLNTILAATVALFVVNFVPVKSYTEMFTQLFGEAALVLAGMLLVFIILGMIMITREDLAGIVRKSILAIIVLIGAGALFLRGVGPSLSIPVISDISIDSQTLITALIIIGMIYIIYSMVKGGGEESGEKDYSKMSPQQLKQLVEQEGDKKALEEAKKRGLA